MNRKIRLIKTKIPAIGTQTPETWSERALHAPMRGLSTLEQIVPAIKYFRCFSHDGRRGLWAIKGAQDFTGHSDIDTRKNTITLPTQWSSSKISSALFRVWCDERTQLPFPLTQRGRIVLEHLKDSMQQAWGHTLNKPGTVIHTPEKFRMSLACEFNSSLRSGDHLMQLRLNHLGAYTPNEDVMDFHLIAEKYIPRITDVPGMGGPLDMGDEFYLYLCGLFFKEATPTTHVTTPNVPQMPPVQRQSRVSLHLRLVVDRS